MIAYFQLFNMSYPPAEQASKLFRYELDVFIFPPWQEIYTTDDERKMSFEAAKDFGIKVQQIYSEYGYTIVNVPNVSAEDRAQFSIERLN